MAKKKDLPQGVRERKGRFTYRYTVNVTDPVTRKKRRKWKETESYPTANEAYDAGIEIQYRRKRGKLVDEKNITLEDQGELWLEDYELEREVKKSTMRMRKYALYVLKKRFGSDERVREITSASYQRMLNEMKKDGKSKSTITVVHSGCSLFFQDCVRKQIIAHDPTDGAVVPAFRKINYIQGQPKNLKAGLPRYLEKSELKTFLEVARFVLTMYQWYVVFLVLSYTGLRLGELRALQWTDFDRKKQSLNITKHLYAPNSLREYELTPPKNDTSEREIRIGEIVVKALIELEKLQQELKREHGDNYHHDTITLDWTGETFEADFIFTSIDFAGYPCCEVYVRKQMKYVLEAAKLPNSLSPHSLRHTHVSILAENPKVQLTDIQQRLGHKQGSKITELIYLHVTRERQKQMPDHFEWVMRG